MTYLLDANALIALCHSEHVMRQRVLDWVANTPGATLATCAITELAVVRIIPQMSDSRLTTGDSIRTLNQVRKAMAVTFLPDDVDASSFPAWVKLPKHTTDGHLLALASPCATRYAGYQYSRRVPHSVNHRLRRTAPQTHDY